MVPTPRMLPQSLTTYRKVYVDNGGGSHSYTTTMILNAVASSIQRGSTPEAVAAGAMRQTATWDIYIITGQDLQTGDVMDDPDGSGGTCEILTVNDLSGRLIVTHAVAFMREGINVK